jgi:nitrite reductase/ring-hydroxylating ferredoxin subunit
MDEHIRIGRKYRPSTEPTYSFGLDDQEFVVSFETDEPADFLDLVMELREARTSLYTLRDTPIFTCIAMTLREALDALAGGGETAAPGRPAARAGWRRVAAAADVPAGSAVVVYHEGEQVALFNAGLALRRRQSLLAANGPLAGRFSGGTTVTCLIMARADLATGEPSRGPANQRLQVCEVRIREVRSNRARPRAVQPVKEPSRISTRGGDTPGEQVTQCA